MVRNGEEFPHMHGQASNQLVFIMQDFEGVDFGCFLSLRCSYLIYGFLASQLYNIIKQLHDGHAQLLVEKFTVYNLSASHKHEILK